MCRFKCNLFRYIEACPIGMLFVRCLNGVSHSPLEHTVGGAVHVDSP
jgi:hypothetical protein